MSVEYFAGLFDGEGCVQSHKYRKRYVQVRAQIRLTDPRPLILLQRAYGGSVRNYHFVARKGRRTFDWHLCGKQAVTRFFTDILPHSVIKRDEIELALQLLALVRNVGGTGKTYDATAEARDVLNVQIRALKHREHQPLHITARGKIDAA